MSTPKVSQSSNILKEKNRAEEHVPLQRSPHVESSVREGRLKSILWQRCNGARYVGLQKGYGKDDLILFTIPGNGSGPCLAIPFSCWIIGGDDVLVALVSHKIEIALIDFHIAPKSLQTLSQFYNEKP